MAPGLWYSNTDTITTASNIAWKGWNGATATTDSSTWHTWASSTSSPYNVWSVQTRLPAIPKDHEKNKEEARRRAEQLLMEHLTPEQKAMYRRLKRFRVVGADGKRYEIAGDKRMQNVFELDDKGQRIREFCLYQLGDTPQGDNLLGQKLLLEADERAFRAIANVTEILRTG